MIDRANRRVVASASAAMVRLLTGEVLAAPPPRPPEKVTVAPARIHAAASAQLQRVQGLKSRGRGRR